MGIYIERWSWTEWEQILEWARIGANNSMLGMFTDVTELPPHGRLIDADALLQSLKESIDECHKWTDEVEGSEMYARVSQAFGTFVECSLRVKAAPTIIPAEEGNNE